ncbi:response regulator transcription factor [Virgisporangium aurantiacum]|uniref:HTH luxR-type domain-containing protein n=1 Tax=Virgisporangium aurantiacum TaxID=175570 RepID=A0A8J3ZG32_9ACTN|nr:helix-turn-helix transcriptional regulator [Virgisporangium aurantiacum]GIJ62242.1 hypothetical protein Vau01_097580 [Virgisporangium aurantiacum]
MRDARQNAEADAGPARRAVIHVEVLDPPPVFLRRLVEILEAAGVRVVAARTTSTDRSGGTADGRPADADATGGSVLSAREEQVLTQISCGLTHTQVARRLGISAHTVDTYVKRIRSKLGAGNKAELTRAAVSMRLSAPPPPSTRPPR